MNLGVNKILNYELLLRRVGFTTLALFFLIAFESKALINVFGSLSLLLAFIYIAVFDRKIFRNNRFLLLFVISYGLGFLLGFLSDAGYVGALAFLDRFKFMLLMVPLTAFVRQRKDLHILLGMFFISAAIAVGYAIYTGQLYGAFHGFHKIGRTADMMVVACLATLVYLVLSKSSTDIKDIGLKFIFALCATFFGWAVLMSEIRGSWLALVIGLLGLTCILALFYRKALIFNLLLIIFLVSSVSYLGNIQGNINKIQNKFESIVETQTDGSNVSRLQLWKTGWDFSKEHFLFGTGAKQNKQKFITFFNEQPENYQNKYYYAIKFPGELHNSYMQIHVETGIVFLCLFTISIVFPLFVFIKNIKNVQFKDQKYLIAAIITSLAFLISQLFHSDLYRYGSTVFYLMLFSGCYILNQNNPSVWFGKGHKK